jgi:hypothetical protein
MRHPVLLSVLFLAIAAPLVVTSGSRHRAQRLLPIPITRGLTSDTQYADPHRKL